MLSKKDYIVTQADKWFWGKLPPDIKLDYSKMPSTAAKSFYLLQDLGAGAEGRVWLGCSSGGKVVVLKFLRYPPLGT